MTELSKSGKKISGKAENAVRKIQDDVMKSTLKTINGMIAEMSSMRSLK
jgi:hypothetical protein